MLTFQVFHRAQGLGFACILGGLAACAAGPSPDTGSPGSTLARPTVPSIPPFETSGREDFDAWRMDFSRRAVEAGRNPAVVYDVLRDLKPLEIYLPVQPATTPPPSAFSEQAEFAKPVWDYLRTAVSPARVETGQNRAGELAGVIESVRTRYGVDGEVVLAIWGMETNFGSHIGDFDGPETLANMAVEGRRQSLAESELMAAMMIIERGYAARNELVAGWAGAMGHTQFMPTTYLAHAVDHDGDGRRDVWKSEVDALASAANYLSASGYLAGQPWGTEVILPDGFNFALANGNERSVAEWRDLGLYPMPGTSFPADADTPGRMWLPAGARGPKYLLFSNFDVFLAYNRSLSYALAVGLLADAIAGRPGPQTPWPTDIQTLSVADVKLLQERLNQMGYAAGTVDGVAGSGTRRALQAFQASRGYLADGYPSAEALQQVLGASQPSVSALGSSPG